MYKLLSNRQKIAPKKMKVQISGPRICVTLHDKKIKVIFQRSLNQGYFPKLLSFTQYNLQVLKNGRGEQKRRLGEGDVSLRLMDVTPSHFSSQKMYGT